MAKDTWTNRELFELLDQIDSGYYTSPEEEVALRKPVQLDLRGTQICRIPESIGNLVSLHGINLSGTKISNLPSSMRKLRALRFLDISGTSFSGSLLFLESFVDLQFLYLNNTNANTLPNGIGQLSNLIKLDLSGTKLSDVPDSIGNLFNLKYLNLSGTNISFLPESIGNLTNLEFLNLNGTNISRLPESIGKLSNLKYLNIGNTKLNGLPDSIGLLSSLRELWISFTAIEKLPPSVGNLKELEYLSVRHTGLSFLPESIGHLSKLQCLDLGSTPISSLPESFSRLSNLRGLDLDYTKINVIPTYMGSFPRLRHLDLAGLTLPKIPKSLVDKKIPFWDVEMLDHDETGINLYGVTLTQQNIFLFLEHRSLVPSLYLEKDMTPLNECRVIFLGDGEAGKSYTIKRIRENGRKESKESPYITSETPGVEIVDYHVDSEGNGFDIHFWDFGGQQILHSMHRCFLTEETCYVVVVKTRDTKANERARYWLRNIRAFAPYSPTLLFVNCWENDDGLRAINEPELRDEFPSIVKVVYCSAKQAEAEEFRENVMIPIFEMAADSEGVSKMVPKQWINVRKAIEDESKSIYADGRRIHYLDKNRYHALCSENEIKDEFASDLLSFFNNLGVCFSFHRDSNRRELAEYKLLDPVWLTNAIYAIIEEGMAYAKDGRIMRSAIEQMLCNEAPSYTITKTNYRRTVPDIVYKDFECQYIIEIAELHNLCYRIDASTMFFPALCTLNTPPEVQSIGIDYPVRTEYRFQYDYLPNNVIHQLMIRCMQKGYAIKTCWLSGMVVGNLDSHRVVARMANDQDLKIEAYSKKAHSAWEIFPVLRNIIINVNKSLKLKAKEQIVDGSDIFPLVMLIQQHKNGHSETFGSETGKTFQVSMLLGQFFDLATLSRIEVVEGNIHFRQYKYHPVRKVYPDLRIAIWEAYNRKCRFCGKPLDYSEMQIEHILSKGQYVVRDSQTILYLEQLKEQGFDIDNPDYIENYYPVCQDCNRREMSTLRDIATIRAYHLDAIEHTEEIVNRMDQQMQRS